MFMATLAHCTPTKFLLISHPLNPLALQLQCSNSKKVGMADLMSPPTIKSGMHGSQLFLPVAISQTCVEVHTLPFQLQEPPP